MVLCEPFYTQIRHFPMLKAAATLYLHKENSIWVKLTYILQAGLVRQS